MGDSMIKNFNQPILEFSGEMAIKPDGKPFTMTDAILVALSVQDQKEAEIVSTEKFERFQLGLKVVSGEADFTLDELAKIKTLVGKAHPVITVGRIWKYIEEKETLQECKNMS